MSSDDLEATPSTSREPAVAGSANRRNQPLIYACSGCSSSAQMANHIAVRLDRDARAEMSCIAGVGGDVPSLVRVATSGRPIVVVDGCPLRCAEHTLARHGVSPDRHFELGEHGVRKRQHDDFDPAEAERLLREVGRAVDEMVLDGAVSDDEEHPRG